MERRVAIVTGVTGQDGSYLSELLLSKGYTVVGISRRTSTPNTERVRHLLSHPSFSILQADMGDFSSLLGVFHTVLEFDRIEVYNLAAQSQVHTSFLQPEYTAEVDALGPLRILECIRILGIETKSRVYQASTSELYGKVVETPQRETTPFYPRSPYGVAKLYAFWIVKNYRESYGLYACNGILFNHESERRGSDFLTRKVTLGLARIYSDPTFTLEVGNLDAKRDWGHAEDYVYAMWLMLQQEGPNDYVIASGETHSVREFIEIAVRKAGHSLRWEGSGTDERGIDETGRVVVRINPIFYRPAEVDLLIGDPSLAETTLGWKRKISFETLIERMVISDLRNANRSEPKSTHLETPAA